jgi:hypothetical protein
VRAAPVREEEEDGQLGHDSGLGRLRCRVPVGRGGAAGLKKGGCDWAERPDGAASRWAD